MWAYSNTPLLTVFLSRTNSFHFFLLFLFLYLFARYSIRNTRYELRFAKALYYSYNYREFIQKERIIIKAIIFDLDDTLIKTSELYNCARDEFSSIMQKLGFSGEESLIKLDEIDISYIQQYGFLKERYPHSLGETYEFFCKKNGEKIDELIKRKIENIGWQVFEQIPELVDDVYSVLETLRKKYFLILATLGDPRVQEEKVKLTGLNKYFSDINILKHKNVEEYQNILKRHHLKKKETWIIGNSVRSDLNPGLKIGLNCILIPYLSWKFEDEKPVSKNYLQVKALIEILEYL
ncbi:MAG: HAD family hydrolase [Candidatus Caldatribacteriota bacterium]|nr:HAD family hydrolase [Candidatus Caldatribacteriota bacterium]